MMCNVEIPSGNVIDQDLWNSSIVKAGLEGER